MAYLLAVNEGREVETKRGLGSVRPIALRYSEALALPAALLPDLPVVPTLGLHVPSVPGIVRVALDEARAELARQEGEVVIDADEWRAIVQGAEADRLWPAQLAAFCARKRAEPAWRIEPEIALAGAQPDPNEQWSARRVLQRIGAEVLSIDLG
jgi:hypothetical protein